MDRSQNTDMTDDVSVNLPGMTDAEAQLGPVGGQGQTLLDSDEIEQRLAQRGLRLTPQRRAVLSVVLSERRCMTAAEVHDHARQSSPDLGLMTVYRTLDLLAGLGVVRRVHGEDRCESFVPAGDGHGHTVVCSSCGRISEFTRCDLSQVAAAAGRETGFSISGHFLQFSGLCGACRAARSVAAASTDRGTTAVREQPSPHEHAEPPLDKPAGARDASTTSVEDSG